MAELTNIEIIDIPEKDRVKLYQWAEIAIERWKMSVKDADLKGTGKLFQSFTYSINEDAKNNKALISFAFEYYLRMLEMGVGKGIKYKDRQEAGITVRREMNKKRKRHKGIYSKVLYHEVMRLGELVTNQYAVEGATIIIDDFKHGLKDKKTEITKFSKQL